MSIPRLSDIEVAFEALRAAVDNDAWRPEFKAIWDLALPAHRNIQEIGIAREQAGLPIGPSLVLNAFELSLKLRHFQPKDRASTALSMVILALAFSETVNGSPSAGLGKIPDGPASPPGRTPEG